MSYSSLSDHELKGMVFYLGYFMFLAVQEAKVASCVDKEKPFKLAALVVFIFFIYLVLSPFATLGMMYFSVTHADEAGFSEYVDFSMLRINLEKQLVGVIDKTSDGWLKSDPFTVVEVGFSSEIAKSIVEGVATPEYLMRILQNQSLLNTEEMGVSGMKAIESSVVEEGVMSRWFYNLKLPKLLSVVRYSYDSFDQFSTWWPYEGRDVRLIFVRSGLGWKMANIILPVQG